MIDEYAYEFTAADTAYHPDGEEQNIWVNIGCEFGGATQLTMGIGEPNEDGFYKGYVSFDMEKGQDIMKVISMLNSALDMLKEYNEEFS